jgi:hypothetical protein
VFSGFLAVHVQRADETPRMQDGIPKHIVPGFAQHVVSFILAEAGLAEM